MNMKKIKIKNLLFFVFANVLIFLILELFLTFFFVYHQSNYFGPIAKFFYKSEIKKKEINIYEIRWDRHTQKMIPGTYRRNDVEFKVNSLGFLSEEFSIKNEIELLENRGYSTNEMRSKLHQSIAFPFFLLGMILLYL